MEPWDLQRHQLIEHLLAQPQKDMVDVAMTLWEKLAAEIISIVGEGGFNALYARSVFLAQPRFRWLADCTLAPAPGHHLAGLKACLEGQPPEQVGPASSLLFLTFTDIVAALIGEQLTASILRAAWGDDASCRTSKEFKND